MRPEQADDLLTWMILGVILGGRLGYVLFYQPAYFAANPGEILADWHGGMSFHGGLLGVAAGVIGFSLKNRLGIPMIYGVDSVHGHDNMLGATIFPHNIGLGASRDPKLVEKAAHVTAEETRASGIPSTGPSTRGPSGSSSSRMPAA